MGNTISAGNPLSLFKFSNSSSFKTQGQDLSGVKAKYQINVQENTDTQKLSIYNKSSIQTALNLSEATSELNKKEAVTDKQIETVDQLISLAYKIKDETNLTKADELSTEAENLLNDANNNYTEATSNNEFLNQDQNIVEVTDSSVSESSSEKYFKTTILKTSSLSDLGLSSNTSFSKSDIDSTISSLENIKSALSSSQQGYSNSRSAIAQEVSSVAIKADSLSKVSEIENMAQDLAKKLVEAPEKILEANNPNDLNVKDLISESDKSSTSSKPTSDTNNNSQINILS